MRTVDLKLISCNNIKLQAVSVITDKTTKSWGQTLLC